MGINAQTSVPKFTAGDTLTAANTNLLANGIPVFGGTALRDAAFGGSNEKVLAEGQYAYLEDTNTTQFYDGAAWQPVGTTPGLVYITGAPFTTQSTISMPAGTFTSTYKNYKVQLVITAASGYFLVNVRVNNAGTPRTGASYYWAYGLARTDGAWNGAGAGNSSTPTVMGGDPTRCTSGEITVFDPTNASGRTHYNAISMADAGGVTGAMNGGVFYSTAEANDGLTFTTSANTITGYYRVYGFSES